MRQFRFSDRTCRSATSIRPPATPTFTAVTRGRLRIALISVVLPQAEPSAHSAITAPSSTGWSPTSVCTARGTLNPSAAIPRHGGTDHVRRLVAVLLGSLILVAIAAGTGFVAAQVAGSEDTGSRPIALDASVDSIADVKGKT